MSYENILVDQPAAGVGRVRLNRPKALNALNSPLMDEVMQAMSAFNDDETIGAMILTGDDKAFAAGADIKEMDGKTQIDMLMARSLIDRFDIQKLSKPIIAAVSGYALGGGCEVAMSCDMIVASETAVFGQPEINLGIIPRRRRHTTPDPRRRQSAGYGNHADRPQAQRAGSLALRLGQSRSAAG